MLDPVEEYPEASDDPDELDFRLCSYKLAKVAKQMGTIWDIRVPTIKASYPQHAEPG